MQAMFDGLKHRLVGGTPVQSRAIHVYLPEGAIAEALGVPPGPLSRRRNRQLSGDAPAPFSGVSVVLRGTDPAQLQAGLVDLKAALTALGGEPTDESPDGPQDPDGAC